MSNEKSLFYGLALLFGTSALFFASFYYIEESGKKAEAEGKEVAMAEEHSHKHDHEDENRLILTNDQIRQLGLAYRIAGPGELLLTLPARGKIILHPDLLAHIIPKVSGIAHEATKNIGNEVQRGGVMAILESRDMADVKAVFLAALSKNRLANSTLQREERLYREKVSAGQDYLNAKNSFEESLINLQLAKQNLKAFGLGDHEIDQLAQQKDPDLRLYTIRSPLNGTVIMRHITRGEYIENTSVIYEVADLSHVWVEIGIYPKDLFRVKPGQMVEIATSVENKRAQARLIYVSPIVADETIAAKAVAELDNSQGLWRPGIFVKATIATDKTLLPLVISKSAVQSSEGKDFVFIVIPDGFEKRFVKLGLSDQESVEVLSGISPGEKYVANKTFLLKAELGKSSAEHEH
ncbi:HlyD family secretion protein [Candidatus Protochlamydia naegleriophila]|uniref:HlyD family secretion protein n=1 Tax=Candidatus Protochlamydia naegleriophila TaxID=389348 RepID=A0A0U5JAA6_9BACT|nr:efflux RND transporter periplasmic adaptor subunit [Candidatus Protochlamydia naegleriophila]CUI16055.1 HlyD family secretion protein [Candidatus Protochlamydia naegleriophila]